MTRMYGVREFATLAGVTVKALHHDNTDWNTWEQVTRFVEQLNQLNEVDPGRARAE